MSIYEITNTQQKRNALNNLTDSEKLNLIYKLTDSKGILEVLEFIADALEESRSAREDAEWCQSYR